MEELQDAMDDLLRANPEMTFYEASKELVKKGELNFDALEDVGVHTYVYGLFQHAKRRAQNGRINQDI